MLIHVDLNKHQYQALSISRDTRVGRLWLHKTHKCPIYYSEYKRNTTKCFIAAKAIEELTGVPMNYYVETNYQDFQSMANIVGNVEVYVPFDVTLTHPWYKANKDKVIHAGTQLLSGQMITELVHERGS